MTTTKAGQLVAALMAANCDAQIVQKAPNDYHVIARKSDGSKVSSTDVSTFAANFSVTADVAQVEFS